MSTRFNAIALHSCISKLIDESFPLTATCSKQTNSSVFSALKMKTQPMPLEMNLHSHHPQMNGISHFEYLTRSVPFTTAHAMMWDIEKRMFPLPSHDIELHLPHGVHSLTGQSPMRAGACARFHTNSSHVVMDVRAFRRIGFLYAVVCLLGSTVGAIYFFRKLVKDAPICVDYFCENGKRVKEYLEGKLALTSTSWLQNQSTY